ncbi:MAG: Fe-S cluster assembly protein SufD [Calditrichaeota bacterium]|nr:MAG: Fe-S cluster assembly protein SufD [Calditrichota bacterium]
MTKHIDHKRNNFAALNTAFFQDGVYLNVADSVVIEKPIQLLFISKYGTQPGLSFPRNLYRVGKNSQISVDERYLTLDQGIYFTDVVSEIILADNAQLYHYKIQLESEQAYHFGLMHIAQDRNSHFFSQNYSFGGKIVRNDIHSLLNGEGSECTLNGLYLAQNRQLVDNHTVIEHAQPHCNSHELYKGILNHQARAVFSGKIHVHQDAQKTDAIQSNQNLLLSEEAVVDTKPQLEIYADDVRCTHGGTVGQLDEDGIFYLRSRGISREKAHHLMIQAFAGQVVDTIPDDSLRETVAHLVEIRLKENSSQFLADQQVQ